MTVIEQALMCFVFDESQGSLKLTSALSSRLALTPDLTLDLSHTFVNVMRSTNIKEGRRKNNSLGLLYCQCCYTNCLKAVLCFFIYISEKKNI